MKYRTALGVGAVLLLGVLAGCSAAGSLELQPASDDAELAEMASRSASIPDEGPATRERIVQEAIENGSTTAKSRDPELEPGLPYAHDGAYYNVSWEVIDREPGVRASVAIDYNGTAPANATVDYENLSARDQQLIDELLPPRTDRREPGPEFGIGDTYNESERAASVLLSGEYDAVRYEGEVYPVRVDGTRNVTVRTYRYTATVVANDSAEYADHLRENYLFTLSGLSDGERSVVEEAVNDGYYADTDDDEAFRSVMNRFRDREAITQDEYEGLWLVEYDGEVYVAELYYGGFDEE